MNHKDKCKALKNLRKKIADEIGVDLHQTECTYQGECSGTCPKCANEEKTLNKALLGSSIAAASVILAACGTQAEFDENVRAQRLEDSQDRIEDRFDKFEENQYDEIVGEVVEDIPMSGDVSADDDYYDDLEGMPTFEANYSSVEAQQMCCGYFGFEYSEDIGSGSEEYYLIHCYNMDGEEILDEATFTVDALTGYAYDEEGNEYAMPNF